MEMEKTRPASEANVYKRQKLRLKGLGLWEKKKQKTPKNPCYDSQNRDEKLSVCRSLRQGTKKMGLRYCFHFSGQTLLARLFYSR